MTQMLTFALGYNTLRFAISKTDNLHLSRSVDYYLST